MKKNILILLFLMLAAILAGCSAEEVLSVGKPFHGLELKGSGFILKWMIPLKSSSSGLYWTI
ncbi:YgdI/YgdR family lipoprotein [Bacillus infantis]|uniref:hypothetical protein n=1 Tax=Bacillus infantis TaxID=324767 RepID=UPI000B9BB9F5|nr:hypothetical protein [Bacillus infantis]MCK6205538.1 YgdI/YgdR family lipoprotein [Bacillus infantis]OXT18115.1 hypothetical protein B9K06_06285 [Bacillus sp. OG2]